jgi:hypothetical protein
MAKSRAPIRSTKDVSRLVSFGIEPARVDYGLTELLRTQEASGHGADRDSEQVRGRARRTGQFAQGELTHLRCLLPVWQKILLRVITVWDTLVLVASFSQRFIFPVPPVKTR